MSIETVGDLRQALSGFSDETPLLLGGDLTIYRVKRWGDDGETQALVEFNEIEASLSDRFRNQHPEVVVAFCRFESDGNAVQKVSVPNL